MTRKYNIYKKVAASLDLEVGRDGRGERGVKMNEATGGGRRKGGENGSIRGNSGGAGRGREKQVGSRWSEIRRWRRVREFLRLLVIIRNQPVYVYVTSIPP
jgi:hypothetical protein